MFVKLYTVQTSLNECQNVCKITVMTTLSLNCELLNHNGEAVLPENKQTLSSLWKLEKTEIRLGMEGGYTERSTKKNTVLVGEPGRVSPAVGGVLRP